MYAAIVSRRVLIASGLDRAGPPPRRLLHDVAEMFQFSRAIVGSLTDNFATSALRHKEPEHPIDMQLARQQLATYHSELRKAIPKVVQVPPDDRLPDLVFVEDPAVVMEGTAMLTRMRPPSRAGEVVPVRPALEELGLRVVEMGGGEEAYLDGGDIVFTGREFLVGLTERTNAAGIEALAKAFPKWPVTGINVLRPLLHLKSMSSIAGIDLVAISDSPAGREVWRQIEANATHKYKKLVFPDNNGANCLYINGVVYHPPKEEYPESYKVWETLDCPRVSIPNSEMAKADGSLTCNSIRIN